MLIIKEDSYSWCIIFIYTFISVLLITYYLFFYNSVIYVNK